MDSIKLTIYLLPTLHIRDRTGSGEGHAVAEQSRVGVQVLSSAVAKMLEIMPGTIQLPATGEVETWLNLLYCLSLLSSPEDELEMLRV